MITLLLVDDEDLIREGMRDCIDWTAFGIEIVGEAANGLEALELARRTEPDIVMTDVVMPEMDGILLAEALRIHLPMTKVVMISAYQEVQYLKSALKHDVVDYVLKPVQIDELTATVRKTADRIRADRKQREQDLLYRSQLDESMPLLRNRYLLQLLDGIEADTERAASRLAELGLALPVTKSYVCYCCEAESPVASAERATNEGAQLIETKFGGFLAQVGDCHWAAAAALRPNQSASSVLAIGRALQHELQAILGCVLTVGAGRHVSGLADIGDSYMQAKQALLAKATEGKGRVYVYSEQAAGSDAGAGFPAVEIVASQDEIIRQLMDGDFEGVEDKVAALFDRIRFHRMNSVLYMRTFCAEIWVRAAKQLTLKGTGKNREPVYEAAIGELYKLSDSFDMEKWLLEQLEQVRKTLEDDSARRYRKSIRTIMDLIDQRYAEELSVPRLAEAVSMSANHMAAVFKKEVGVTVNDYVTDVRIKRAKLFLSNPVYKVYEIADKVGYRDADYFARLFKRHTGMTPQEFRDQTL